MPCWRTTLPTMPYPIPLLQLRHHDHSRRPLLPYHPPEVCHRLQERSLRRDVRVLLAVAITVVCVDVVAARQPLHWGEDDAGVVVGDHVGVAVLGFVGLEVRVVPCELLARLDRL